MHHTHKVLYHHLVMCSIVLTTQHIITTSGFKVCDFLFHPAVGDRGVLDIFCTNEHHKNGSFIIMIMIIIIII
jgi:hypothetical protein